MLSLLVKRRLTAPSAQRLGSISGASDESERHAAVSATPTDADAAHKAAVQALKLRSQRLQPVARARTRPTLPKAPHQLRLPPITILV